MSKEVVYFGNIDFVRNKRKIIDDVTWQINEGENWALMGLNGSGKSTLLGMLPAYNFATRGVVRVFGETFGQYSWREIRKRIGFVSNTLDRYYTTLMGEKTLDVVISGKFSSIGIYESVENCDIEKAGELVRAFGLERVYKNEFCTLSQGEQRRTLIARAFMNEPELMILDEPCAGLDIKAREFLLEKLNDILKTSKMPMIYVTHLIDEIVPSVTHVAMLNENGSMKAQGEKKSILTEENLKKLYGIDLRVINENDRYWLVSKVIN